MYRVDNKNKKEYRRVTTKAKYFVVLSLFLLLLLVVVGSSAWNLHLRVIGFVGDNPEITNPVTIVSGTSANNLLLKYVDYGTTDTITYNNQTYYAYTYDKNQHTPVLKETIVNGTTDETHARPLPVDWFVISYTRLATPNPSNSADWISTEEPLTGAPTEAGIYRYTATLDRTKAGIYVTDTKNYLGSITIDYVIKPRVADVWLIPDEEIYGDEHTPNVTAEGANKFVGNDYNDIASHTKLTYELKSTDLSAAGEGTSGSIESFTRASSAGKYLIYAQDVSLNYDINYRYGVKINESTFDEKSQDQVNFTIQKRDIKLGFDTSLDLSMVYGTSTESISAYFYKQLRVYDSLNNIVFKFENNNFVNDLWNADTIESVISLSFSDTQNSLVDINNRTSVGIYKINASINSNNENYRIIEGTIDGVASQGIFEVTPAPLTITAFDKSTVYGDNAPAYTGDVEGEQNEEVINIKFACSYTKGSDAITYIITPSLDGEYPNYEVTKVNTGNLTVNKRTLHVTIGEYSSTYGDNIDNSKIPYSLGDGESIYDVNKMPFTLSTTATKTSPVGSYSVTGSVTAEEGTKNYTISFTNSGDKLYTIIRRLLLKPTLGSSPSFVYSGSSQTYNTNNINNFDSNTMDISGNVQTAAGSHTMTISLKDKVNYAWKNDNTTTDVTLSWTIDKMKIAKPYADGYNLVVAYTGTAHSFLPADYEYTDKVNVVIDGDAIGSSSATTIYNVTVSLKNTDNYAWVNESNANDINPLNYTLEISVKTIVAIPTIKATGVYTYDGVAKELSELFDYDSTHVNVSLLSFTLPGATEVSVPPSECKNAGKYVYRFELIEPETTYWATFNEIPIDLEITINPISVTLRIKDAGHTYGDTKMGPLTFTLVSGTLANNESLTDVMSLKTDATIDSIPGTGDIGGKWRITPDIKNSNYDIKTQGSYNNIYGIYTIDKKSITVNTVLSLTYPEAGRTWADIKNNITEKLGAADLFGDQLGSDTLTLSFTSMSNGVIIFSGDSCTIDDKYITAYTNAGITAASLKNKVPGSTYVISGLSVNSDKYKLIDSQIILKYKTAKIGSTYYTIEDALYQTNSTISFAGDASNYVLTTFSHITPTDYNNIISSDGFAAYNSGIFDSNAAINVFTYSLSNSNTLLVPYTDSLNEYEQIYNDKTSSVYSALFIDKGIRITINSGSALVTGAIIDGSTGVNQRGVIVNEGRIDVKGGGAIRSYGYIKSSSLDSEWGTINVEKDATVLDVMTVYNWIGGNSAKNVYKKAFPVNAWSIHNISCTVKFSAGSIFNAFAAVTADNKVYSATGCIISPNKNGGGMFYPENADDTNSYIVKKSKPANSWKETDASYKALYTLTGDNSTKGQKDIIEIYGNYRDCAIKVSLAGLVEMDTGLEKSAPLAYMDVYLKNGATFTMESSDYSFMPGTKLVIEENANLTIGNGVDVAFLNVECFDVVKQTQDAMAARVFITDCIDKVTAYVEVNGNLVVNGKISGLIKSSSENSTLILNSTTSATFTTVTAAYGTTQDILGRKTYHYSGTANLVLQGILADNSNVATAFANAGTYVSLTSSWVDPNDSSKKICYWETADTVKTITFNFNGGSGLTAKKTVILQKDASGNLIPHTITADDLQTPNRSHYIFKGWYLDETLTTLAEGSMISADCIVYAKWEAEKYDIIYEYPGLSDEQKAGVVDTNLDTQYVYGEELILKVPTHGSLNFVGWYEDIDLKSEITSIAVGMYNSITIYGKWSEDTPCTYDVALNIGQISGVSFDENSSTLSFKGTANGGASAVIGDIYANYDSIRDLLNESFMNSDNLQTIKDQKQYNFDSYFGGWKLSYTKEGSTIEKSYNLAKPTIEIDGGATDIRLTAQWEKKVALNIVFKDLVNPDTAPHSTITKYFKSGLEIPNVGVDMLISSLVVLEYYDYINFDYSVGDNTTDSIIIANSSEGNSPILTAKYKKWFTISKTNSDTELSITIPSGKTGVGLDNGKLRVSTTTSSINIAEYFKPKDEAAYYVESYSSNRGTITNNSLTLFGLSSKGEIGVTAVVKAYFKITFDVNGSSLATPNEMKFRQGDKITGLPWNADTSYVSSSGCDGDTYSYFQGWFTAKNGGSQVKNNDTINGNMTLYAQWSTSKQTSNPNGGCVEFANGGSDGTNTMTPIFVSFITVLLGGYIILNKKKKKNAEK